MKKGETHVRFERKGEITYDAVRTMAALKSIIALLLLNFVSCGVRFAPSDLNDFLSLEKSCILPLQGGMTTSMPPPSPAQGSPPPGSVAAPIIGVPEKKRRRRKKVLERPHILSEAEPGSDPTRSRRSKNLSAPRQGVVASVTLSDCLSCSGCVTSAEEVILKQHNPSILLSVSSQTNLFPVATLSPHSCVSLAASYHLPLQDTVGKVSTFLRNLGVRLVFDAGDFARLALEEAQAEFVRRWRHHQASLQRQGRNDNDRQLPMLCSECPGFVLFVEKTYGKELIPFLSSIKSPQAVAGTVVKRVVAPWLRHRDVHGLKSDMTVWHCTLMPCHDKKLESAREQLRMQDGSQEIDSVLTTSDFRTVIELSGVNFTALPLSRLDRLSDLASRPESALSPYTAPRGKVAGEEGADVPVGPASSIVAGTGSGGTVAAAVATSAPMNDTHKSEEFMSVPPGGYGGGYAEAVARHAARELFGISLPEKLIYSTPKRGAGDMRELRIRGPRDADGEEPTELRVAVMYGFRHIQALVNDITFGRCPYHYVEVLSCPSGCTNGGGQIAPPPPQTAASMLEEVNALYDSAPLLKRPRPWPLGQPPDLPPGTATLEPSCLDNTAPTKIQRNPEESRGIQLPSTDVAGEAGDMCHGGAGAGSGGGGGAVASHLGLLGTWFRIRELSTTEAINDW